LFKDIIFEKSLNFNSNSQKGKKSDKLGRTIFGTIVKPIKSGNAD